jgi:hypothetical protein
MVMGLKFALDHMLHTDDSTDIAAIDLALSHTLKK